MDLESTRELVLRYFGTWPRGDWEGMRACMADTIDFNGQSHNADAFVAMCAKGARWERVELLDSIFADGKAALLYEGIDTGTGSRMRVGEFIRVADGKVRSVQAAIAPRASL